MEAPLKKFMPHSKFNQERKGRCSSKLNSNHRSYVTVAIGCTGGQHRSVFLVEELARVFSIDWSTRVRHREIGDWPARTKRADDLG